MENKVETQNTNFKNAKCKRNMRMFGNNKESIWDKIKEHMENKVRTHNTHFSKNKTQKKHGNFWGPT
jgi:predicted oxidoreductase (fatty acid repression mutant protein)